MKKILSILICAVCLMLAYSTAHAQSASATAMTKGVATALVNTASDSATIKVTSAYTSASFQSVVTKVSGTPAGTVKLYGSLDGTNFVNIASTDSLIITNVAKCTHIWNVAPSKYLWYRLVAVGAGTMNVTTKGWFLGRQ